MKSKIIFFVLIILAVTLEVFADILFKKYYLINKNYLLYFGMAIYFIGTFFWAISLKYDLLSKAVSIFTILNLVTVVLVGVLYFNESISLVNKVGIFLGVISVILIEL